MANRQYKDPTTQEVLGYYTKVQLSGEATPIMNIADCSLVASEAITETEGTSDKILTGHTAYGNDGRKMTGTCDYDVNSSAPISGVQLISDGSAMLQGYGAYAGANAYQGAIAIRDSQEVSATQTPSTTFAIPDGYYLNKNVTITGIDPSGIQIAEGTTLFGVVGHHGGAAPVQEKTTTSSLTTHEVTPDQDYVLSKVTVLALPQNTVPNTHGYTLTLG